MLQYRNIKHFQSCCTMGAEPSKCHQVPRPHIHKYFFKLNFGLSIYIQRPNEKLLLGEDRFRVKGYITTSWLVIL